MGNCTSMHGYSSINSPASPRIHPRPTSPPHNSPASPRIHPKPTSPPQLPRPSDKDVKVTIHHASNIRMISSSQLLRITSNFSNENLIGRGGFGPVYKGTVSLDPKLMSRVGNVEVAVKHMGSGSDQGRAEWLAEISFLRQLKQENLVKLIGYSEDDYPRCLIYEYHSRGSLDGHLYSDVKKPLSWTIRKKIAHGAAMGLAFMHGASKPVVLRDFKSSNILLDEDYTPKICDFGIARNGPNSNETHVSTQIKGTYGYVAPDYLKTGHLNAKTDVYSFGVVLLELLTGRRAMDSTRPRGEQELAKWVRPLLNSRDTILKLVDQKMEQGSYDTKEILKFASLANKCLNKKPRNRPHMKEVVAILKHL